MSKSKSRSNPSSFWKSNYKPKRYPLWYGISEDAFVRYMQLHADDVRSEFDNLIKGGFTRWVRQEYVYADAESVVKFAC